MSRTLSLLAAAALTCVAGAMLAQALDRATQPARPRDLPRNLVCVEHRDEAQGTYWTCAAPARR